MRGNDPCQPSAYESLVHWFAHQGLVEAGLTDEVGSDVMIYRTRRAVRAAGPDRVIHRCSADISVSHQLPSPLEFQMHLSSRAIYAIYYLD